MIAHLAEVRCDACGIEADDLAHGAVAARHLARLDGWHCTRKNSKPVDLCPACKPAGGPP